MKNNRKVSICFPRGGIAVMGCSSMWAGTIGGECHSGNHVGLFILPASHSAPTLWAMFLGAGKG